MLEILFYGFATFFETGMGIYFFGKMFPKRERMEKRHYAAEWGLYSFLMVTAYTFPAFFLGWKEKNIPYIGILCSIYVIGIAAALLVRRNTPDYDGRQEKVFLFVYMSAILIVQYWTSYLSIPMALTGNVVPVIFLYAFYECKIVSAYLWTFTYYTVLTTLKILYITLVGGVTDKYFREYFLWPREPVCAEAVYWIVICLMISYLLHFELAQTVIKKFLVVYKKTFFIATFILWRITLSLVNYGYGEIDDRNLSFTLIILVAIILVIAMVFVRTYGKINEKEKQILDIRNSAIEAQYREMNVSYEKYRKLIHDERYLISYVSECLNSGDIEEAVRFLHDFEDTLNNQNGSFKVTGIQNLDILLNIETRKMNEKNIKFTCDLNVSGIPIKNADFVILMGNLLDNAIEAAEKCMPEERAIELFMKNVNQLFLIKIRNSCMKKPVWEKSKFLTDKKEKSEHGWGIESARQIIKKYDGDIMFSYDNSNFEVKIMVDENEEI